jgi:predicted secreted protein
VEANLDLSAEAIDTACKDDTTGFGSYIIGNITGSLSGSGYAIDNGTNSYSQLLAQMKAKNPIAWKLSDESSGSSYQSGNGFITSLNKQGGVNDAVQFSFTITITGEVTDTAIA